MSLTISAQVVFSPALLASPEQAASILEKLADFTPVLEAAVGPIIEEELAENFATRNWGGWAPLAPSTVLEKQRRGDGGAPDLVRDGTLQAAFVPGMPGHKFLVSPGQVIVGVYGDVVPYAEALAEGDPARRLPPRVLIAVRPGALEEIVRALTEWLGGGDAIRVYLDAPVDR